MIKVHGSLLTKN